MLASSPCTFRDKMLTLPTTSRCATSPHADRLLSLGTQALAIGHVAHIADGNGPHLALLRPIYDRPRDLVLNIPRALLLLGQEPILAGLQVPPAPGTLLLAGLLRLNLGQPLGGVLVCRAQATGRHHDGRSAVREGGGANLTQGYRHHGAAWRWRWLPAFRQ